MLAGILRGVCVLAVLALFMWTSDRFLMLACALCAGAVLGHEFHWNQVMGSMAFAFTVSFWSQVIAAHGAVMTASFFPVSIGLVQGYANFLMLAAVGAFVVWKVERTMDLVEEDTTDPLR